MVRTGKLTGDEFVQYIVDATETDGDIYRQMYRPIVKNMAIFRVKGVYDKTKALKPVGLLAEAGIKKFKRQAEEYYGTKVGEVPLALKRKIAAELLAGMEGEILDTVREMKRLKAAGKPWQRNV